MERPSADIDGSRALLFAGSGGAESDTLTRVDPAGGSSAPATGKAVAKIINAVIAPALSARIT
jgi:hypothetical protein